MSNQPPYDYHSQYGGNMPDQQGMYPPQTDPYAQPQQGYAPTDPYTYPPSSPYPPEGMPQTPNYYPASPYNAVPYTQPERGRGIAIASLVMGIISIFSAFIPFVGLIFPILGIVFGILGRRSVSMRTVAIIGLVTSIIGILLSFVMLFVYYNIGKNS